MLQKNTFAKINHIHIICLICRVSVIHVYSCHLIDKKNLVVIVKSQKDSFFIPMESSLATYQQYPLIYQHSNVRLGEEGGMESALGAITSSADVPQTQRSSLFKLISLPIFHNSYLVHPQQVTFSVF